MDQLDQNTSYYPFTRKTQKWTTKFGYYLLCIALYNSYVLWRERAVDPNRKYMHHLEAVAERWTSLRSHPEGTAEQVVTPAPSGHEPFSYEGYRTRKDDPECRLNAAFHGHFLREFPQVGKKTNPTRPCRVCYKQAEVKASRAAAATAAATGSDSAGGRGGKKKKKTTTSEPEKKNRQESRYYCKCCLVPLHSMPKLCFELYHTKKDYAHV